jgi:FAD/FMN-containing dehydrogenase
MIELSKRRAPRPARGEGSTAGGFGRRGVLAALLALPLAAAAGWTSAWAKGMSRARPNTPGWPTDAEWGGLRQAVGGRLAPVSLPTPDAKDAKALLSNPFYLGDEAGLTQSSGWLGAWRSAPSVYAVKAKDAADVSAAVRFAAAHRLRLVVKGGGHSYMGGSNAPDSLLVWTRAMNAIEVHDAFVPRGSNAAPAQAVSVGAGCVWLHVYDAVTTQKGRYVQGGGCTTVGVAGLVQGGGFGSFSKGFGLAAASLLEAEIVTADGTVRIVNAAREPDLFWALKGGGGGTFGVVTRLTLATHPLPEKFGAVRYTVKATTDEAYRKLLDKFLEVYAAHMLTPHWGEQAWANTGNRLVIEMVFQGIGQAQARAAWDDLDRFVNADPVAYKVTVPLLVFDFPAQHFWDAAFLTRFAPDAIVKDTRPGAAPLDFLWAGDKDQAGTFWSAYSSAWMPASLLEPKNRARLTDAWFEASRHWSAAFHFNKGLAGGDPAALAASRDTAMNPQVLDAFALAIIAGDADTAFIAPGPDLPKATADAARVQACMAALRKAAPDAGGYLSECDYFTPDWRRSSWGEHWPRLDHIKRRYDPHGLFVVHHGVGSEDWSPDGFTQTGG